MVEMELIDTLKAQHQFVLEIAKKVDESAAAGDVARIAEHLVALKTGLVAHLELEDRKLYPRLIELATERNNPSQVTVAKLYASNMGNISDALLKFLSRNEVRIDLERFRADWASIKRVLGDRITSEEMWLYPMYKSLSAADAREKSQA